jgi:N-acetylglucosamine malate deacetylase 1
MKKKIIFFAAHHDDIELGCGGTALKYKKIGYEIYYVIFTKSGYKNEKGRIIRNSKTAQNEAKKAAKIIGVNKIINLNLETNDIKINDQVKSNIINILKKIKPCMIFVHWRYDVHHDHRIISDLILGLSKNIENVFLYRSNFLKSNKEFTGNFYVNISKEFDDKIKAIKEFKGELKRVKNSWIKLVKNENKFNGFQIKTQYAEKFEVVRMSII